MSRRSSIFGHVGEYRPAAGVHEVVRGPLCDGDREGIVAATSHRHG